MGTFAGHILPGSFFILFGVWWMVRILQRYYKARYQRGRFQASITYSCSCLCGRAASWEVEGIMKVFFTSVGFIGEIVTGWGDGHLRAVGNGQHATMFFFFGLSGVIDIVCHHSSLLPRDTSYIIALLALVVEGLLFKMHVHLSGEVEILIHTLLVYAILASILAVAAELRVRDHVLVALGRPYTALLQGTWFWQIAFILYDPLPDAKPWEETHDNMLIASMMFAWHMAVNFLVIILTALLIGCYYRRHSSDGAHGDHETRLGLINGGVRGRPVSTTSNSDDDVLQCGPRSHT